MPGIREYIQRVLGISKPHEDHEPSVPVGSKRSRYDSMDNPPLNKRYRAVHSHFPKFMPVNTEEEDWRTPRRIQNKPLVYDIPVRREDLPSGSYFTRDNVVPKDSCSPRFGRKLNSIDNDRGNFSNQKINENDTRCTCISHCAVHSPTRVKRAQFTRRSLGNCSRTRNMIDNILADSNNLYKDDVINVDDDDDDDCESVEVVEPKSCYGHITSKNNPEDVEPSDSEYEVVLVKPAVKRGTGIFDTLRRKMSSQHFHHSPLHRQNRINKCNERSLINLKRGVFSKYLPNYVGFSKSSNDRFGKPARVKSSSAGTASFKLIEKKCFQELIARSSTPKYNDSRQPYQSSILSNILFKTPVLEKPKTDIIDLTETLYDKDDKYENGKATDTSEIHIESSDDEVNTVAQFPIVSKGIPENSLKLSMQSKMITQSSWIQHLTERYEKISICKENEIEKIEIGEEEEQLIELSEKQEQRVNAALKPNPPNEILIEKFNMSIHRRDIQTLSGLNWLNDEVINFYMNLIMERSQKKEGLPKVYGMNTFFFPKLIHSGHIGLKRWTRKVDIFSYDIMLVPVHLGVHWCMSVINFKNQDIRYYDSMGGKNMECCAALLKYLEDERMDKKKESFNRSSWKLECVKDIPQQMNGSDCGMFSCMFAEYISRKAAITFTQNDMPYFRRKMIFEIIEGQLLV